jgi:hypothetical protein
MPQIIPQLIWTAVTTGVQMWYSRYERKRLERLARKRVQAIDVEYSSALEPRRKLYGRFRAAGMNVIPPLCRSPNRAVVSRLVSDDSA